jgi:hypothetical protein
MVRYPHIATVEITSVITQDGEYVSQSSTRKDIQGRLESVSYPKKMKTINGDWVDVKLRFCTPENKIDGATSIIVDGIDYHIITWLPYQTYSEIWLD